MHFLNPDLWFIFNLHREFFFILHVQVIMSGCTLIHKERKELIYPSLERQSLDHCGDFPSSQVPYLKSTAFVLLALSSPPAPASRQKDIYLHTDDINMPATLVGHNTYVFIV